MVRFPDGMRDQLKAAAAANNRSMNAEIIARIQASFDDKETSSSESVIRKAADEAAKNAVREIVDEFKSTYFIIDKETHHLILSDIKELTEEKKEKGKNSPLPRSGERK